MQLPAVCLARRNHGKNKMSAKCLLQIICIQSVKEICELKLSWQKFLLSTLVRMLVESCTHLCSEANHLPRINLSRQKLPLCDTSSGMKPSRLERSTHQARASAPRCLSDNFGRADDLGTDGLGFDDANPPTHDRSTGCRNRSTPVVCTRELDLDENRTQAW